MRKSRQNNRLKSSINIPSLILLGVCVVILFLNMFNNGIITEALYKLSWVKNLFPMKHNLNMVLTIIVTSVASFSISKLISQWKETTRCREIKKEIKIKTEAMKLMNSKELLDVAMAKDKENLKNALGHPGDFDKEVK